MKENVDSKELKSLGYIQVKFSKFLGGPLDYSARSVSLTDCINEPHL